MDSRRRNSWIIIALYFGAVITCISLAFDFKGAINFNWTLVLIGLTLPWSVVSVLFAWALIHGAGLEMFTLIYLAFAGINAKIFYAMRHRSKTAERAQTTSTT